MQSLDVQYFFKSLGCSKLASAKILKKLGMTELDEIIFCFRMNEIDYQNHGISIDDSKQIVKEVSDCRSAQIYDWKLLSSIGMKGVNEETLKRVLKEIPFDKVVSGKAKIRNLSGVTGVGPSRASKLHIGVEHYKSFINDLVSGIFYDFKVTHEDTEVKSLLHLKRIAFTGSFKSASRQSMIEKAHEKGALVQNMVNPQTDFLVCADDKLEEKKKLAQKFKTEMLSETNFLKLVSE